ncbi:uncharacterized protein LOC120226522, partial [Hyaena hyaena]|uniref:uncharacterized protein LOC120226522 n=1 Tax=Hyaena hyaena TaxID=95912 RepID=UPI001922325E
CGLDLRLEESPAVPVNRAAGGDKPIYYQEHVYHSILKKKDSFSGEPAADFIRKAGGLPDRVKKLQVFPCGRLDLLPPQPTLTSLPLRSEATLNSGFKVLSKTQKWIDAIFVCQCDLQRWLALCRGFVRAHSVNKSIGRPQALGVVKSQAWTCSLTLHRLDKILDNQRCIQNCPTCSFIRQIHLQRKVHGTQKCWHQTLVLQGKASARKTGHGLRPWLCDTHHQEGSQGFSQHVAGLMSWEWRTRENKMFMADLGPKPVAE